MPSTNKTPYLGLSQWVTTDVPKMEDFNRDNQVLDTVAQPLHIAGNFPTLQELQTAYPSGDGTNSYIADGTIYVWTGDAWRSVGIDLNGYYNKTETNDLLSEKAAGDENGNAENANKLADKGPEYYASTASVTGKADKAPNPIMGHLATLDSGGNPVDSGLTPSSFIRGDANNELFVTGGIQINSYGSFRGDMGGGAAMGANCYQEANGNIWRALMTHSCLGALAIRLSPFDQRAFLFRYAGATTTGQEISMGMHQIFDAGADSIPTADNARNVGSSSYRFANIYLQNAPIVTSDEREKEDIEPIDKDISKALIMGIQPSSFKMEGRVRTHYGLISQQVYDTMQEIGLKDFGGYIKSPIYPLNDKDEPDEMQEPIDYKHMLRYEEFIAPLIVVVQEQQKQIESLMDKIVELQTKAEQTEISV